MNPFHILSACLLPLLLAGAALRAHASADGDVVAAAVVWRDVCGPSAESAGDRFQDLAGLERFVAGACAGRHAILGELEIERRWRAFGNADGGAWDAWDFAEAEAAFADAERPPITLGLERRAEGVCAAVHGLRHRFGNLGICGVWHAPDAADELDSDFENGAARMVSEEPASGARLGGAEDVVTLGRTGNAWRSPDARVAGGAPLDFPESRGVLNGTGMLGWNVPRAVASADSVGTDSFGVRGALAGGGAVEFRLLTTPEVSGSFAGGGMAKMDGAPTNGSTLIFSAGKSDIFENIRITGGVAGGARVIASGGGTASFFGDFTQNGAEVRVAEDTTIVIRGALHGAGALTGGGTVSLTGSTVPATARRWSRSAQTSPTTPARCRSWKSSACCRGRAIRGRRMGMTN